MNKFNLTSPGPRWALTVASLVCSYVSSWALAPVVTKHPSSQLVETGSSATLSAEVNATGALTYQWKKGGIDIPSATSSSLSLINAQSGDAGSYTVSITNGDGTVIAGPAALLVGSRRVVYVKNTATGANNGSSWLNAYTTLTSALASAVDGDEIWIAGGVYKPSTSGNRDATFTVSKFVILLGGFSGSETQVTQRDWRVNSTILSGDLAGNDTGPGVNQGDNSKRLVSVTSANGVILDGLTITGGSNTTSSPDFGCGLGLITSSYGGSLASSVMVRNCIFKWNYALSYGGAIGLWGSITTPLTVDGCAFIQNSAPANGGGAIQIDSAGLIVTNSLFLQNTGSGSGAITVNNARDIYIANSVFSGNTAGGGMQSSVGAGAIRGWTSNSGRYRILNCTLVSNTNTRGTEGAISLTTTESSNSIFANSIVSGSGSNPIAFPTTTFLLTDQTISGIGNLVATPQYANSANVVGVDGLFATRDDGLVLKTNSPGIDTASTAYATTTDATGVTRTIGVGPDRGAYETDLDTDGDGIFDRFETGTGIYVSATDTGTSPLQPDTDGDGLTDGQEVITYHSDPVLKDTDNDGFEDGFEVFTGFDPTSLASTPEAQSSMLTAVEFRFNAATGISYRIESSSDLAAWSLVENNIMGTGGTIIRFYSITGITRQFYRARRN